MLFRLADAQTSGGLLLSVSPRRLGEVLRLLTDRQTFCQAVIGEITTRRSKLITNSKPHESVASPPGSARASRAGFCASQKSSVGVGMAAGKVRDGGGAIAGTRGACAPRMTLRRAIPAVEKVLEASATSTCRVPSSPNSLGNISPRSVAPAGALLRRDRARPPGRDHRLAQTRLQPVINGTGIVLHTNFGAPLSAQRGSARRGDCRRLQQPRIRHREGRSRSTRRYLEHVSPSPAAAKRHRREQRRGCARPDRASFHEEETRGDHFAR